VSSLTVTVGDPPANADTVLGFVTSPEARPFRALHDIVTASPLLVIAERVTLYLAEPRVPGGRAC
jgi:hypothetical protein